MDLKLIELAGPGGGWVRADRVTTPDRAAFAAAVRDQVGDQAEQGKGGGLLRAGGAEYRWRFTPAADEARRAAARAELARQLAAAGPDADEFLEGEAAAVLARAAGLAGVRPRELEGLLAAG